MKPSPDRRPRPRLTPTAKREAEEVLERASRSIRRRWRDPMMRQRERDLLCVAQLLDRHHWRYVRPTWHQDAIEDMARARHCDLFASINQAVSRQIDFSDEGIVAVARKRLMRAAMRACADPIASRQPGSILTQLATLHQLRVLRAQEEAARARAKEERLARETNRAMAALVLPEYRRCGYRGAEGKWVGGHNDYHVVVGDRVSVVATTSTVWHKKHKWTGTDLSVTLYVHADWPQAVLARGLAYVEERLTLSAEPLECEEEEEAYQASWVEQSRGLSLVTSRGVLYRRRSRGPGSAWLPWVHAATLRGARTVYARQLSEARAAGGAA